MQPADFALPSLMSQAIEASAQSLSKAQLRSSAFSNARPQSPIVGRDAIPPAGWHPALHGPSALENADSSLGGARHGRHADQPAYLTVVGPMDNTVAGAKRAAGSPQQHLQPPGEGRQRLIGCLPGA